MNIQIHYYGIKKKKKKAERYFKERRIPFQSMDLKKHRLGEREIRLMINGIGMDQMIDRDNKKVREHPACYYDRESLIIPAVQESPWLLRTPIVRNGNSITTGYRPEVWAEWK